MSLRLSSRRCRGAVVAVAAAVAPAALGAQGITYDFTVRSEQVDGGKAKEVALMAGRSQVDGDRARIDLTDVRNGGPMASKDAYVIVTDGGRQMRMVNPKDKEYYTFNTEQMIAGASGMLKALGGMVKMEMSNVKIDVADLGAGEAIQGYDTRKLRMVQSYTMSVSVLGRKSSTTTADTTELWVAPALSKVQNPFLSVGNSAASIDFGNPEFRKQQLAANAKLAVGAPLRSVSRNVATDDKGKQTVTVSRMEVTNLKRGDVPASAFAIPSGYKEVPMPFAELAALGDSVDAANARSAAAAGEKKEEGPDVKDAAKDAGKAKAAEEAKKKLGGLLKKWP